MDQELQAHLSDPRFDTLSTEAQKLLIEQYMPVTPELETFLQQRRARAQTAVTPKQEAVVQQMQQHVGIIPGRELEGGPRNAGAPLLKAAAPMMAGVAGSMVPGVGPVTGPLAAALTQYLTDPEGGVNPAVAGAMTNIGGNLFDAGMSKALMRYLPTMLPYKAGPIMHGALQAIGGLGGLKGAETLGFAKPSTLDYALVGGLPIGLGTTQAIINKGLRGLGRLFPGAGLGMGEEGLDQADAYVEEQLGGIQATREQAQRQYKELAEQAGNKASQLSNNNLLALRRELAQQEEALRPHAPGLINQRIQEITGVKQLRAAEKALPRLGQAVGKKTLTADTKALTLQKALAKKNPDPQRLNLLQRSADLADIDVSLAEQTRDDFAAIVQELTTTQNMDFKTAQVMLKRTSDLLDSADGEMRGDILRLRKAIWQDMDDAIEQGVLPEAQKLLLQRANTTFRRALAMERLGKMTTNALDSQSGVAIIQGDTLHANVLKAFREEDDLFRKVFSGEEAKNMLAFYSTLARETAQEHSVGLAVAMGGLGAMAGHLVSGNAMGASAGAAAAQAIPGMITRIVASHPTMRRMLLSLIHAGQGRVSYDALVMLDNMAQREVLRDRDAQVEVVQ